MSKKQKDSFVCLTLSRNDFRAAGYNPATLTDETMQDVADEIGESCTSEAGTFWLALQEQADVLDLQSFPQV